MTKDQTNTETNVASVSGDGGNAKVTDAELIKFKDEVAQIARAAAYNVNERRFASEETRFTIWEGQSPDGRKHSEAQDGKPAFPFEGASDARIRLADQIVNERVLILTAAALRNLPRVKGLELDNEDLGHRLTTVLKWVLKNKLGSQYFREIVKLAQYQEADSPAGAVLGVWWEQEVQLEMQTVTTQQLMLLLQQMGLDAPAIAELEAQLMNPDRDDETAQALQELLPHLTAKRAKQVVAELRENQTAEYPSPYLKSDHPVVCSYRLFEDIFMPTNTTDGQRCRCYFVREWVAEWDLRERIVSENYDPKFVDEALKHEAESMFPLYRRNPTQGDFMVIKQEESKDSYRGMYELVHVYFRAVNEDNVPGIFYLTMHGQVKFAAYERRLLDFKHGQYPFTWFTREILGTRLLDSRGVPELVATEQWSMKLLADSFNDNVSLATVPPIKVPRRRTKMAVVIGPLKIIKEDRPGDVSWMEPPAYPQGNQAQQAEIRRRVDEYFGRISAEIPPMLTQLHQNGMVLQFLSSLTDALTQMLQLCQQYISDEELAMITGEDGKPIARSRQDIQGKFNVELTFDPRDLDMDYLKNIVGMIVQILQIDTLNTVQRDKLVQRLFMAIDPNLATETLRPVEAAQQSEIEDEENNFTKINAGIEPPMVANGLNFPLRLQVLQGIPQKNPEAFQKLTPVSRQIYEARVKYLANQVQQLKNAQIGRQVGQPALGGAQPGTGVGAPSGAPGGAPGISGGPEQGLPMGPGQQN
jgi:hypothetical protein